MPRCSADGLPGFGQRHHCVVADDSLPGSPFPRSVRRSVVVYSTPVIFPLSKLPAQYRWIMLANPMTPVIETFRYAFLGTGTFSWKLLGISAAATSLILAVGILLFNKVEKTFMDTV